MLGYRSTRTTSSRPCRNGPLCHYQQQGRCWFSHAPSHQPYNPQPRNVSLPPPMAFQYLPRSSYDPSFDEEEPEYEWDVDSYEDEAEEYRTQVVSNVSASSVHSRFMNLLQMKNKNERDANEKKQKLVAAKNGSTARIGQKQVPLLKISCSLPSPKKWFFEQSQHFMYEEGTGNEECSICVEKFSPDDLATRLYCSHAFHRNCIEKWFESSAKCPLCRQDFQQHEEYRKMEGFREVESDLHRQPLIMPYLEGNFDVFSISSFVDYPEDHSDDEYIYQDYYFQPSDSD